MRDAHKIAVLVAILAAGVLWAKAPSTDPKPDKASIEAMEPLAESLTGAFGDLSAAVRRMDLAGIESHFAGELDAGAFPSLPGELKPGVKWIQTHAWDVEAKYKPPVVRESGKKNRRRRKKKKEAGPAVPKPDRAEFLGQIGRFLSHFSAIDDARFDVKEASFPDPSVPSGQARVAFSLVGRDFDGRREWVRGEFDVSAAREGDAWRFGTWKTNSLSSEVVDKDLFVDVTNPAGLARPIRGSGVMPGDLYVAHGGAAGDVNGDGLLDIVLTSPEGDRLYLNDGKGSFEDVSEKTLVKDAPPGTGALILDYDNDGDEDIFLSAVGNQVLLENYTDPNHVWTFRDVSDQAGVAVSAVGLGAAAADVNNDGKVDIYVASYNKYGSVMPDSWTHAGNGTPNLLFLNLGNGLFRESARLWRVDDARWSTAAAFTDLDGDGWQDLYVTNDFGDNALYSNKSTVFEDEALRRGVQDPADGKGASFGDFDDDGDLDLLVADPSSTDGSRIAAGLSSGTDAENGLLARLASGASLFQNRGNGYFDDVSAKAGPFPAGWMYGGGFLDFDNDGWDDVLGVNGFITGTGTADASGLFWRHAAAATERLEPADDPEVRRELMDRIFKDGASLAGNERDALFVSRGDGTFENISGLSGLDEPSDDRAAIFADFDNDGDMDVLTTGARKSAWRLLRNDAAAGNGFLRITLEGTKSGKDAFGAMVRVKTSRGVQTRIKSAGSGFLSQHDPRLLFGLGKDEKVEYIEVIWPSGERQRSGGTVARDSLKITEGAAAAERVNEKRFALPQPESASARAFAAIAIDRGGRFPRVSAVQLNGNPAEIHKTFLPGRNTLVVFWASWSLPCRAEVRELQSLWEGMQAAGVDLVGVSLDYGRGDELKAWLKENGILFPVLLGDEASMRKFLRGEGPGLPFALLVDAKGIVSEILPGWTRRTQETLRKVAGAN